jgi:hypothetical protein
MGSETMAVILLQVSETVIQISRQSGVKILAVPSCRPGA